MIILRLRDEDPNAPLKRFVLSSGREVRPDKETGAAYVLTEDEALELEAEGWQRQASKAIDADMLRKVVRLESQRHGIVQPPPALMKTPGAVLRRRALEAELRHGGHDVQQLERREFGKVSAGRHGRLIVSHEVDGADETIAVLGVNVDLDNLDPDLGRAFQMASSNFAAAEDAEEQTAASILIGAVVASILDRHEWLAAQVRRQQHRQRYAV